MAGKRTTLWAAVLLAVGIATGAARADLMGEFVGDPVDDDSWTQGLHMWGGFDFLGFEILSGGPFVTPVALSDFSPASWNLVTSTGPLAAMSGPAVSDVFLDLHFAGPQAQSLSFQVVAYLGGGLVGAAEASWNGSGWTPLTLISWDPGEGYFPPVIVPLPAPIAMAGMGLVAVILGRKRIWRLAG